MATQPTSEKPYVSNYPDLARWLDAKDARCQWQKIDRAMAVEGWLIDGVVVVVLVYANRHGWEIFTAPATREVQATFADVNARIAAAK